jgi:hypothetical protein
VFCYRATLLAIIESKPTETFVVVKERGSFISKLAKVSVPTCSSSTSLRGARYNTHTLHFHSERQTYKSTFSSFLIFLFLYRKRGQKEKSPSMASKKCLVYKLCLGSFHSTVVFNWIFIRLLCVCVCVHRETHTQTSIEKSGFLFASGTPAYVMRSSFDRGRPLAIFRAPAM